MTSASPTATAAVAARRPAAFAATRRFDVRRGRCERFPLDGSSLFVRGEEVADEGDAPSAGFSCSAVSTTSTWTGSDDAEGGGGRRRLRGGVAEVHEVETRGRIIGELEKLDVMEWAARRPRRADATAADGKGGFRQHTRCGVGTLVVFGDAGRG